METFKKGDVVKLKSGGPDMTVENVKVSKATCIWFVNGAKKKDIFDVDTLELVPRPKLLPHTFTRRARRSLP